MEFHLNETHFFTPKKFRPLNLDLRKLEGGYGGSAQFYGETHDGKSVYCKYASGVLKVTIEEVSGTDVYSNYLFHEQVGPSDSSLMTQGQLCNIVGITVNGWLAPQTFENDKPDIHEYGGPIDLSGEVIFYNGRITGSKVTQFEFLEGVLSTFDVVTCLKEQIISNCENSTDNWGYQIREFHSLDELGNEGFLGEEWYIYLGRYPEKGILNSVDKTSVAPAYVPHEFPLFRMVTNNDVSYPHRPNSYDIYERINEVICTEVRSPTSSQDFEGSSTLFQTCFPMIDKTQRKMVEKFEEVLCHFYPQVEVCTVDIAKMEIRPDSISLENYDPRYIAWCMSDPTHFLDVTDIGIRGNPNFIGTKPLMAAKKYLT